MNKKTSIRISEKHKKMWEEISKNDQRSQTAELAWLIEKRYKELKKEKNN